MEIQELKGRYYQILPYFTAVKYPFRDQDFPLLLLPLRYTI